MTDFENRNRQTLDDQLDGALANYAAVEPRAGLEQRILTNLKAHEKRINGWARWRWTSALAVALLIATLVVWRLEKHGPQQIVRHDGHSQQQVQPQVATKETPGTLDRTTIRTTVRKRRKHVLQGTTAGLEASISPKLEQFPSPQPITPEEEMLLDYVGRFHHEAAVIARLQTEQLERNRRDEELEKPLSVERFRRTVVPE